MEFWGVEVKAGEPLHVTPEDGEVIHMSQVALGDVKNVKSANSVTVCLTVDDKKLVIGRLSAERYPQIMFDLVIEKDFTLSHDWKDGSLFFCGYTCEEDDEEGPGGDDFSTEEDSDSEDEEIIEKGKPEADVEAPKPTKSKAAATKPESSAKPKVTLVDPKKDESDDTDGSDEDGDDESDDDDLDDDSDDDMSEDEETPKKVESSKKRPSSSEIKTPASTKNKKSKTETPKEKVPTSTNGKKGSAHTATPHPAKKSEKKTADTPKSSAQLSCKSCSKTFNSEKGLESHSKAKHGGK